MSQWEFEGVVDLDVGGAEIVAGTTVLPNQSSA